MILHVVHVHSLNIEQYIYYSIIIFENIPVSAF